MGCKRGYREYGFLGLSRLGGWCVRVYGLGFFLGKLWYGYREG
jgi:hypothetical protein